MSGKLLRIAVLAVMPWCVTTGASGEKSEQPLRKGDLLYIDVYRVPELTSTVQIDADGEISLPYVGSVNVNGMTPADASAAVALKLKQILRNPRVTVLVTGYGGGSGIGGRTSDMILEAVPLQNASAATLSNALEGMSSPGGNISHDPDTNTLFITDTPETIQNMIHVVSRVDQMQSQLTQVRIDTKIVEVREGALKEFGMRWFVNDDAFVGGFYQPPVQDPRIIAARGNLDPAAGELIADQGGVGTGIARRFVDNPFTRRLNVPVQVPLAGQAFFGLTTGSVDIGLLIDALVTENEARLLANPMLLTVNHKTAYIKMVDEFPYSEFGTEITGATNFSTRFLDLGITLEVTPHVHHDAAGTYVKLELIPEVSFPIGSNNGIPIRSVRRSESIASVRDGQTLVVGGILSEEDRKMVSKVPWIGDIPVLGSLFKRKEKNKARTELMIFVTPTVYEHPEDITWDKMISISDSRIDVPSILTAELGRESRKD